MLNNKRILFSLSCTLITSFFFTSCNNSTSNLKHLKFDNGIVWVGEVTTDYILNEDALEEKYRTYLIENKGDVESKPNRNIKENKETLATLLIDNCGDLDLYKDEFLKKKISQCDTTEKVTIDDIHISFDPETFEEIISVAPKSIDATVVNALRLKQLVYYQKNTMSFQSIPLAIAPLDFIEDAKTKEIKGFKPLFWIKANETTELNWDNIEWGKSLDMSFSIRDVRVIKEENTFEEVIDMMMKDIRDNASERPICPDYGGEPMKEKEIEELGVEPTLVFSFNKETFEEEIYGFDMPIDGKAIPKIAIRQEWGWDKESGQINIKYLGFLPIVEWKDDKGNVVVEDALFYRNPYKEYVTPNN